MLLHEVKAPGPIDGGVDLLPCLQRSVSGMQQSPIWLAMDIQDMHLKAGMNAADYKRCLLSMQGHREDIGDARPVAVTCAWCQQLADELGRLHRAASRLRGGLAAVQIRLHCEE